jgi:hypothetical protein
MIVIYCLVLLLMATLGYSAGIVLKKADMKPTVLDMALLAVIWAAVLCSQFLLDLPRWIMIISWVVLTLLVGLLVSWPQKKKLPSGTAVQEPPVQGNILKKTWKRWRKFTLSLANYENRVFLSILYFICIPLLTLILLITRKDKKRAPGSFWLPRDESGLSSDRFRSQY